MSRHQHSAAGPAATSHRRRVESPLFRARGDTGESWGYRRDRRLRLGSRCLWLFPATENHATLACRCAMEKTAGDKEARLADADRVATNRRDGRRSLARKAFPIPGDVGPTTDPRSDSRAREGVYGPLGAPAPSTRRW